MSLFNRGTAAVSWALVGVAALFLISILRLGDRGIQTVNAGLSTFEWIALVALTLMFVYTEGHRAIQKRFTPGMMVRLRELRTTTNALDIIGAPFYALSLMSAPRRVVLRTWAGVFAIIGAVFIVRALPEPWRGIIDLAVAIALTWGFTAILVASARLLVGKPG